MEKYNDLLKLARESLESKFNGKEINIPDNTKEKFSKKKACFVTLTKNRDLRGCIGSLEAHQELWKDVIDNAINAGFHDYRFPALSEDELDDIKIEISVLTKPKKLGKGGKIFDKIDRDMGIILRSDGKSATFLPQVWKQIPNKQVFLEQLCLKAGLFKDDWKESEIWFYKVEKEKE